MTGSQKAVLWIGLIIVTANLVMKWPAIRSIIFGSGNTATATPAPPTGGATATPNQILV